MAFLASGEDPNYGKYAGNIHRAVVSIIQQQDATTGYLPNSMYHHGFGMLALSEAYGAVDESLSSLPANNRPAASPRPSSSPSAAPPPRKKTTAGAAGATIQTAPTPIPPSPAPCSWACSPRAMPAWMSRTK